MKLNFDEIISFSKNYNYEKISKKQDREVYQVSNKITLKKYIFKIIENKNLDDLNRLKYRLKILSKKLNLSKLLFSKYDEKTKKTYYLYEYIKSNKFEINENSIKDLAKLIFDFNEIVLTNFTKIKLTNDYFSNENKIKSKIKLPFLLNILKYNKSYFEMKTNYYYLCLMDTNINNLVYSNNKLFLLDYDEFNYGELEFDLSGYFLEFKKQNKLHLFLKLIAEINNLKKQNILNTLTTPTYIIYPTTNNLNLIDLEKIKQYIIFRLFIKIGNSNISIKSLLNKYYYYYYINKLIHLEFDY